MINDLKPLFVEPMTPATQQQAINIQSDDKQKVEQKEDQNIKIQDGAEIIQKDEESFSSDILIASPLIDTCRYCKKVFNEDDVGSLRFQCMECKDFVLCLDCFLAQISYRSHRPTHKFFSIHSDLDNYYPHNDGFSLYDDLLLLEGIKTLGFGSWNKICSFMARPQEQAVLLCKHYFMCLNNDDQNIRTGYMNSKIPNLRNIQWSSQIRFTTQINDIITQNNITDSTELLQLTKETLHLASMPLTRFPPTYCFGQLPAKTGFRQGKMPFRMQMETEFINRAEYPVSNLKITFKESREQLKQKLLMLRIYAQRLKLREEIKQIYWSEYQNYTFTGKRWLNVNNFLSINSAGKQELRFKEKIKREYTDEEKSARLIGHQSEERIDNAEQELNFSLRTIKDRIKIRQFCNKLLIEQNMRKDIYKLQIGLILGYKWMNSQVFKEIDQFMGTQLLSYNVQLPKEIFQLQKYRQTFDIEQQIQNQQNKQQNQEDQFSLTEQQLVCIQQMKNMSQDKNMKSNNYLLQILQQQPQIPKFNVLNPKEIVPQIYLIFCKIQDSQQQLQCLNAQATSSFAELAFVQLCIINLPIAISYGLHYIFAYNLYLQQKKILYNINNIPFSMQLLYQLYNKLLQPILQDNILTQELAVNFQLEHFYNQLFQHASDYTSHSESQQLEMKEFPSWFIQNDFYAQNQINSQLFNVSNKWDEYSNQFMITQQLTKQFFDEIYKEQIIFDHSIQPAKILSYLCSVVSKFSLQYINKELLYQLIQAYGLNHKLSQFIVNNCQQYFNYEKIQLNQDKYGQFKLMTKNDENEQNLQITEKESIINNNQNQDIIIFDNLSIQQKLAINLTDNLQPDNQLFIKQSQQLQNSQYQINDQADISFQQVQQIKLDQLEQQNIDKFLNILNIVSNSIQNSIQDNLENDMTKLYDKIFTQHYYQLKKYIEQSKEYQDFINHQDNIKLEEIVGKEQQINTGDYIIDIQNDEQPHLDPILTNVLLQYYRQLYQISPKEKIQLSQFLISCQEQILCSLLLIDPMKYCYIKVTLILNNLTTSIQILQLLKSRPSIVDLIKVIIVKQYKDKSNCVIPYDQLQRLIQQFRQQKNLINYKQYNIYLLQKQNIQKDQQSDQYSIKINVQFTYMEKPIWIKKKFLIQRNEPNFKQVIYNFDNQQQTEWKPLLYIKNQIMQYQIYIQIITLLRELQFFKENDIILGKLKKDYQYSQENYKNSQQEMQLEQQTYYQQQQRLLHQQQKLGYYNKQTAKFETQIPPRILKCINENQVFQIDTIQSLTQQEIVYIFNQICQGSKRKPNWMSYIYDNNTLIKEIIKTVQQMQNVKKM